MKISRKLFLLVLGTVIIALIVFYKVSMDKNNPNKKNTKKTSEGPSLVFVTIVKPVILNQTIRLTGDIMANNQVELHSEISGRVNRIYFKEGSHVSKNEILVKINDADLQAQLKKQEFQKKLYDEKVIRQKKLLESNSISKEEYDNTLTTLNMIRADIDLIHAQIDKTEIRAPFGGTVGLRSIDEGNYITPTIAIAKIIEADPVKIDFSIPEKYANAVRCNDSLSFSTQNQRKKYSARIYATEPDIDAATRSLNIRAICSNKNGEIIPGSFAEIELILNRNSSSIMIPNEAILPVLKGKMVYLFKSVKAQSTKVITGLRTDLKSEILEGINDGDTLITTGIMKLRQGLSVKIMKIIP